MTAADNRRRWLSEVTGRLDRVQRAPGAVLAALVRRDGLCMQPTTDAEPVWREAHLTDRELAALLCHGCPVQAACLELELRTAGRDTVGVWGGLPADDRRALYRHWARQRGRAHRQHDHRDTEGQEGGRRQ